MKLELEGLLKEAFGVDQAKASDLSNPNTPYTFANTLEWAVGVQPKKEPNQLTEGTPLAKSIPQISSAPEAPLEEPLINPFDIIGPNLIKTGAKAAVGLGNMVKEQGIKELQKLNTGLPSVFDKIIPDTRHFIVKGETTPTWDKTAAEGFVKHENSMTTEELWNKYKTYRGKDGQLRQYDYDGGNEFKDKVFTGVLDSFKSFTSFSQRPDLHEFLKKEPSFLIKADNLENILKSPTLYKTYPEFKDMRVNVNIVTADKSLESMKSRGDPLHIGGSMYKKLDEPINIDLEIPSNALDHYSKTELRESMLDTLHHEVTHAAQFYNKFSVGSSSGKEFITKAQYDELLKEISKESNAKVSPETIRKAEDLWDKIDKLHYKNYLLAHGESEARASEEIRKWGPKTFAENSPIVARDFNLAQKAEYYNWPDMKATNLTTEAPKIRLALEYGNAAKYNARLNWLQDVAHSRNIPLNVSAFLKPVPTLRQRIKQGLGLEGEEF